MVAAGLGAAAIVAVDFAEAAGLGDVVAVTAGLLGDDTKTRIAAIARIHEYLAKAGIHRHYANYPDLSIKDWPSAYYGLENYRRLQKLKALYDPENRIRHPQSVRLPG